MHGHFIPAFIAALVAEGVDPRKIENAVGRVQCLRPGQSISGDDPMRRAFAFEQAKLLERAL